MSAAFGVLEAGTIFGRDFRVVRALRAGGMGAVYIVDQLSTGKQRALKVMAPELATDPATRERFVLEARAASQVDSDHVVEVVTAGIDEATGSLYLVMELLRGEELADIIERMGRIPLGDTGEILSQVGHALELAHGKGIVHRDLKPENIFLAASRSTTTPFTAKILDFGIAKLVADAQKTGTQPLGTPLFMPPEQTDRRGRISPASDVWPLGLITFRMLTGRDFWREADGSLPMLLREICVDEVPFASLRAEEMGIVDVLPPGFDAWFAQCVNRDPDARFAEAGAAVRAFNELVPPDAPRGVVVQGSSGATGSNAMPSGPLATVKPAVVSGGVWDEGSTGATVMMPEGAPLGVSPSATAVGAAGSTTAAPASITNRGATDTMEPNRGTRTKVIAVVAVGALAVGGAFALLKGSDSTGNALTPVPSSAPSVVASAPPAAPTCAAGMVLINGGTMIMGSKDGSEDARITHKVTLSTYCLDKTEVTTAAYDACVQKGHCEKAPQDINYPGVTEESKKRFSPLCNARREGQENHPINCVDYRMAKAYCEDRGARLPTEAEWEFAARGSSQRTYPWGDDPPNEERLNACGSECMAWGKDNGTKMTAMYEGDDKYAATAPVGSFPKGASSAGVLDLAGNVWEWTADWYDSYHEEAQTDPQGPATGSERVARGGAFNGAMADWAKPAYRWKSAPDTYNHAIGFRCAATPK